MRTDFTPQPPPGSATNTASGPSDSEAPASPATDAESAQGAGAAVDTAPAAIAVDAGPSTQPGEPADPSGIDAVVAPVDVPSADHADVAADASPLDAPSAPPFTGAPTPSSIAEYAWKTVFGDKPVLAVAVKPAQQCNTGGAAVLEPKLPAVKPPIEGIALNTHFAKRSSPITTGRRTGRTIAAISNSTVVVADRANAEIAVVEPFAKKVEAILKPPGPPEQLVVTKTGVGWVTLVVLPGRLGLHRREPAEFAGLAGTSSHRAPFGGSCTTTSCAPAALVVPPGAATSA